MACWSGQTSLDTRVIGSWCGPYVLQFSYFNGAVFGLPADSMSTPTAYAMMEMASPYQHVTADDPPAWMYYSIVDTPTNSSQAIHHINYGKRLKMKMDTFGIESTVLDPTYTSGVTDAAVAFFYRVLNTTGVEENKTGKPTGFILEQNYPNPFNPETVISYVLPASNHVTLTVYDMLGNTVNQLVNGRQSAGKHTLSFSGKNLASGVYYYTLNYNGNSISKKMALIK
ncbi:MAG: T9SS type A sorting domain-containing protein [Ignavibacteriales bacterium]|nr:T9SS type A sorting domain-containing protein [Ignavibacteriales bacterium]